MSDVVEARRVASISDWKEATRDTLHSSSVATLLYTIHYSTSSVATLLYTIQTSTLLKHFTVQYTALCIIHCIFLA